MKEHRGDEIRAIMAEMPAELVQRLQDAFPEHNITEREARWWGYMMFARSGSYEGVDFMMKVGSTGDTWTRTFIDYVLADRARNERFGFKPQAWPNLGLDR